jgi:hypothetical protein
MACLLTLEVLQSLMFSGLDALKYLLGNSFVTSEHMVLSVDLKLQ